MAAYQSPCPVCGKTFTNSHEWRRMWCSVGCQYRGVADVAAALPVDKDADALVVRRRSKVEFRPLLNRWPDTLAANLREAGALCRAWEQGYVHRADIDEWPATLLCDRPFYPGCNRPAPTTHRRGRG